MLSWPPLPRGLLLTRPLHSLKICNYVTISLLMGPAWQAYFCIAVLRHLRPRILAEAQDENLVVRLGLATMVCGCCSCSAHPAQSPLQEALKLGQIEGFRLTDQLPFMAELQSAHSAVLAADLASIL